MTKPERLTWREVRLLLSAGLFLAAVALKTSGAPWADTLRAQTAAALKGGIPAQQVFETAGRTLEDGGLSAVFAELSTPPAEKESQAQPAGSTQPSEGQTDETAALGEVYMESGFGEDELSSRTESNFPKEVDETVYILDFDTSTPVEGTVTSPFGARIHPISGRESFHYGVDTGAPEGTDICAFAAGTVRQTGQSDSYGNYVIVDHADGFSSLYAHCSKVYAAQGGAVSAGDVLAAVGHTGNVTGDHLHFELWRNGKALDPSQYPAG